MTLTRQLLGREIRLETHTIGNDLSVLLTGGDKAHIGAVSLSVSGAESQTIVLPGHKEHLITHPWAEKLSKNTGKTVCLTCGIHFDDATESEIAAIVALTEEMLQTV